MKTKFRCITNFFCFCFSVLFLLTAIPVPAGAAEQSTVVPISTVAARQSRVIRVGYPIQRGLTMQSEDGRLYGYTYDYLMEISQYTGWTYEFVQLDGSLNEQLIGMMEMLKNGQIDLLGAMYYDESLTNTYAYSGYCYGINYAGLFVPEKSELRESSLYNVNELRVGVYHLNLSPNAKLDQYAQMNNLKIEQVLTDSQQGLDLLLDEGRVDAVLSTDLAMAGRNDMYPIVHFSPSPFYFTTTKGNSEIVRQLDYAISTIDKVNPNFSVQLYNQYFAKTAESIALTTQENDFIASSGELDVVLYSNKPPFQYVDRATGKPAGITVEVLNLIAETSGLSFRYHSVDTYSEYVAMLESGEADIAGDALSNYQDAINLNSSLTLPWGSLPVVRVLKDGTKLPEQKRIAVPYFLKNVFTPPSDTDVLYFDTVEQCLKTVQQGNADSCYVGDFCSQYLFNSLAYEDLLTAHQTEVENQSLCFGVVNPGDLNLLTILNKCISLLSDDTVNEIIYRNTYQRQQMSFSTFVKTNAVQLVATVMTLLAFILVALFYLKMRQQRRITFENKRYNVISNLANEHFYEYNTATDVLRLSEKCAEYFQCNGEILHFSKKLAKLAPAERCGIWQLGDAITSAQETSVETECHMPDGSTHWLMLLSSVISNERRQLYAVGKISNIQDVKSEQLRLATLASLDGLTGIYNIATAKRTIQEQLMLLDVDTSSALLILDIDNFKQVNDRYGHFNGDAVLVRAAALISKMFPEGFAGRLGGDEFVVFVPRTSLELLEAQCKELCRALAEQTATMLGDAFSWSIGIAWAKPEQSYEDLYREADAALYKVKLADKNGYAFFKAEPQ